MGDELIGFGQDKNFFGELGEQDSRVRRHIPDTDHCHDFVFIKRRVAGGAVGYSLAFQFVFAIHPQIPRRFAMGEDHCPGFYLSAIGRDHKKFRLSAKGGSASGGDPGHFRLQKFRAKPFGLLPDIIDQLKSPDFRNSGIIFYQIRGVGLASHVLGNH